MKKFAEAEQVLKNHEFALLDNNDVLLLYARAQKEQNKPEAIDTYNKWFVNNTSAQVSFEYGQLLESQELYARAQEEYRAVLEGLPSGSVDPSKQEVRFTIARLLLIAEAASNKGITELQEAVNEGFVDTEAINKLLDEARISAANKESIRAIVTQIEQATAAVAPPPAAEDEE
jgi:tetratricopeptide (TPR) repeat protein